MTQAAESQVLVEALRTALAERGDPVKATQMQAYMKSVLPYHGVPLPAARKIFAAAISAHPLPDRDSWQGTLLTLWNEATHREEWYAALALAEHRLYRAYQDPATVPLYERLVVTGAWWDVVDDLATHKIAPLLRAHRAEVTPVVLGWSRHENLWLRRTAVLAQIGAKTGTDRDLLAACIEPNLADGNFFIRKAIGWALRDLAHTDSEWVRSFVDTAGDRMSGLSRREATKHL